MATPRTIAILGACSKNGTTAAKILAANNILLLSDENKEGLLKLKEEILAEDKTRDVETIECFEETGWEADAIVLAIQTTNDKDAFTRMKPYVTGKTVIVFSCGKEDELNDLLPYSKVIRINETDLECINKMQSILSETL